MDKFIGNWTPEEKEIINRAVALHGGANTTNPWYLYKNRTGFSAQRQAWDSGGLRSGTVEELSCKIQAYYSRGDLSRPERINHETGIEFTLYNFRIERKRFVGISR